MSSNSVIVALDIGGTKISTGLVTSSGGLLFRRLEFTVQTSLMNSLSQITRLIQEAASQSPAGYSIAGVGLAVPGWFNQRAGTVWAPNIVGWDHIALPELLRQKVPFPLNIDSDRNAYVLGETWLGCAKGLEDVIFLAIGTGIGAGILSGGLLVNGHDGLAGSVGWFALQPQFQEIYARMGCFEAEASGRSIGRKAEERGLLEAESSQERGARAVVKAAEDGEPQAQALLEEAAQFIGMGVANLISALNPQMVVLGGGLFQQGDYLLSAVRREAARWGQPFAIARARLERSQLGEDAGLYGAARIAWNAVNSSGG